MKKKLAVLLLAGMLAVTGCVPAFAATVTDFTDVKPTAWYYPAVEYAAEEGLFGGTAPNLFSPEGSMTRGMFVTVLGRKAGINESGYLQYRFEDVQVGDYFAPYVEWAAAYGIVGGTGNNCFEPHAQITREQMAVILYRYAQKTKNDVLFSDEKFQSFPDKDAVSGFAVEAMQWATGKGILNGSAGQLLPQGTATRAQVAQVFYTSRDILVKTEITDDPIPPPEKPFVPVPMDELANLSDVAKGMTEEQFKQVYDIAVEMVAPCATLTKEQQLAYVAHAVNMKYAETTYTTDSQHYGDPYGVLIEKQASCAGCTHTVGLCLNILGIPFEHVNEGEWKHQWSRVNLAGTYWICDGDASGIVCQEALPYTHPGLDSGYTNPVVPELPTMQCKFSVTVGDERFSSIGDNTEVEVNVGNGSESIDFTQAGNTPVTLSIEVLGGQGPYTIMWYDDTGNREFITTSDKTVSHDCYPDLESDRLSPIGVYISDGFGQEIRFLVDYLK